MGGAAVLPAHISGDRGAVVAQARHTRSAIARAEMKSRPARRGLAAVLALGVLVAGCGGSSSREPDPLERRLQVAVDEFLASRLVSGANGAGADHAVAPRG